MLESEISSILNMKQINKISALLLKIKQISVNNIFLKETKITTL